MNDFDIMSGVLNTFSHCGLTVRELREEMSRLLNHQLSTLDEASDEWLDLPLQVYLAKLSKGEFDNVSPMQEEINEEQLLNSLTQIEKALSAGHEH